MAFPDIPTTAGNRILFTLNTAGGATKTFPNLSSLTKNAGDLLIAIIVEYDGNSTDAEFSSWGGGFTEIADRSGTTTMAIGVAYKFSTGSETGTFTVTTADTSTNDSVMILLSISGAHASTPPEVSAMTTGTAAADMAALSPSWGAADTLWIAICGSGEVNTTGSFTGTGTGNFGGFGNAARSGITADVAGGVEAQVGFVQENTATQDPGTHSSVDTTNARNAALQIAVRPVPAANQGSATGSIAWAGSATGTRVSSGAASGTITWAGSATGTRTPQGAATGTITWAGSATGEMPADTNDGSASGTITWTGSATGTATHTGTGSGTITWAGTATGVSVHSGGSTGTLTWAGSATGSRASTAAATGTITWVGSATGEAPAEGVNEGSADGTITWSGAATGVSSHVGTSTGTVTWTGMAEGLTDYAGAATGTITWVGAAFGFSEDRFYALSGGGIASSLSPGGEPSRIESG